MRGIPWGKRWLGLSRLRAALLAGWSCDHRPAAPDAAREAPPEPDLQGRIGSRREPLPRASISPRRRT